MERFTGSFTQQEPIPEDAIAAAVEVMRSGRLHRYNTGAGEIAAASRLEAAYAAFQQVPYCLACASGGYAMAIALRAAGLRPDDPVLTNAFTLAPVPGAIVSAGGRPVLVETTADLVIDLDDLDRKFGSTCSRFLLLSSMRGHLADMERVRDLVSSHEAVLVEDCAHTMGASWDGTRSGNFGLAGCFSLQTYKHLNAGEGGLLTSTDAAFMARAIILSGSYMLYERHGAAPPSDVFDDIRLETPNMSGRMDNIRAAMVIPQLARLEQNIERWNARYRIVETRLSECPELRLPVRPVKEGFVGSSLQFMIPGIEPATARAFVEANRALGVELKWFGSDVPTAFTSNHQSWRYVAAQHLPRTDAILSGLFDMRLPLTFSEADCRHIAEIITHCAGGLRLRGAA